MGLGAVLNSAASGLRVSQAAVEVVSNNVANADTVGYTRRQLVQVQQNAGDRTTGVRTAAVDRMLDVLVQRQLRQETSGAGYTGQMSNYQSALDRLFGPPGGASALDTIFNGFTQSLQALASDPSSSAARSQVLSAAGVLSSTLNGLSGDVQSLRAQAESAIATTVSRVNDLLKMVQGVNARIVAGGDSPSPALLDERDKAIDELSRYMDIRVSDSQTTGVTITTTGGALLFNGSQAMTLSFDEAGGMGPDSAYSTDPAKRSVGTISLSSGSGTKIDLIANKAIRSGELAALVELRDVTLVQAQDQLDALASNMALALSDRQAPTTPVTSGAQTGFDIDLSTLPASGGALTFSWRDTTTGQTRTAKIVRVEDASQLPLANDGGADQVIGMSFAGAPASLVGALNTALSPALAFSSAGSALRVLDNGATSTMIAAGARITNTALTGQGAEVPLFVDAATNQVFTGSYDGGSSIRGFAQRIGVNPAIAADSSRLVVSQTLPTTTPAGDATRPQLLLDRLTNATQPFSTATGLGGRGAPFTGSIAAFTQRIVEQRGAAAQSAEQLDTGQNVALSSVKARFDQDAAVNVDSEMAQLTQLQNAYAANARVFTAAREMLDLLMRM
jgi:flagellar hook-associated protein 1 FlgK